jgi:diguanylate cyclase (GGDEF)-like protein
MAPARALPRVPGRLLERVFGGPEGRRQAFDMMARLERAYPASVMVVVLSIIPGLVYYEPTPIVPLAASGVFYLLALTAPPRSRHPELAASTAWVLGLICSLVAARIAGPPYAYLWAGAAISLPFVAVIWPWRVVAAAVTVVLIGSAAVVFFSGSDRVFTEPPALIGPLIGIVVSVVMISLVREVDRQNRDAVLTDVLTGLGNRAALDVYVRELMADASQHNAPIAMLAFDIDHFKALNDRFGHATGDGALRSTAESLRTALPEGGGLFRYGGEEFVVLLPASDQAAAERVAEQMRATVAQLEIDDWPITVSGGLVVDRVGPGLNISDMFQRADAAMYDAKSQGRNRVLVGIPSVMPPRAGRPFAIANEHQRDGGPRRSMRLVRTRLERDHLRVMWQALRGPNATRTVNAALVAASLAGSPWLGWGPVLVAVFAAVVLDPAVRPGGTLPIASRGNELGLFWESIAGMLMMGIAIWSAKIDALYLLPLIAIPAFPSMVAYRSLGSIIVGLSGALVITATGLLLSADKVIENPLIVSLPAAFIGVLTVVGMALVSSTMEHAAAANIDPLTGALNRGALEARVAEFSRTEPVNYEPVTLIVADLDHFKRINDTYGHEAGDKVLIDVAKRLQQELRLVDVLYRVGGEEFVVLLPRTGRPEAQQIAERLRQAISEHPCAGKTLTVSLGLASSDEPGFEYAPAFDRADAALLEAKEHGRNRVVVAGT